MRHCSTTAALFLCTLLLVGCGYTTVGDSPSGGYQWRSLYREDVRTVAVPIFTNKDFRRGVEFSLTKALIQQIEAQSPYKVVDRDRADTILEGEIVGISKGTLSSDARSAIPQEQIYTLTVNFTWKEIRTGRILAQRTGFEQAATYYATMGEGEFVASQQAVEKLALGIVQEMQADW
jgi:hypothetical protein